jgi:uncharacterized protein YcsI (UPF0317 family)
MCTGYVQANIAILPAGFADDFEELCRLNEQALPLIERLPIGTFSPRACASDADLRRDLGGFMVYEGGAWSSAPDLVDIWRDDLVAFVIGCSFSAERALIDAGVQLRHIEAGRGVPIYRTNQQLQPAGRLTGHLVVSMRAIKNDQVDTAARVTQNYPFAHGGPVWTGTGRAFGCRDGMTPDWGPELPPGVEESPVYWACGVTPQTVIEESSISRAVVHQPGYMFITDIPEAEIVRVRPTDWRARNGV